MGGGGGGLDLPPPQELLTLKNNVPKTLSPIETYLYTDQSVLNYDAVRAFSQHSIICFIYYFSVSFSNSLFLYTTATKAFLPCESEIRTKMDRNQPISNRESC